MQREFSFCTSHFAPLCGGNLGGVGVNHGRSLVHDGVEFGQVLGAEHADARVSEVGDAFEEGRGGQVATDVQDAAVFVDAGYALFDLAAQHGEAFLHGDGRELLARVEQVANLAEDPRAAEGGAAHHDGVDAVALKALAGHGGRGDVAVADDGDVDARVVLDLADEGPVGFAGVHLAAGAPVDGQGGDTAVLQLFGQGGDALVLAVPAEAGLDGDGQLDGFDDLTRDVEHEGDVLEQSGAGSLAGYALDGAAEVEVDDVGAGLFDDAGGLDHGGYVASVDLDGYGALFLQDVEFLHRLVDAADEGVGRYELGVDHVGSLFLAEQAEAYVGHILHRRQEYGAVRKRKICYFHTAKIGEITRSGDLRIVKSLDST